MKKLAVETTEKNGTKKELLELAISHKNIPKSKIRGGCTISFLKDARGIKNDSQNETQNLLTTEIY